MMGMEGRPARQCPACGTTCFAAQAMCLRLLASALSSSNIRRVFLVCRNRGLCMMHGLPKLGLPAKAAAAVPRLLLLLLLLPSLWKKQRCRSLVRRSATWTATCAWYFAVSCTVEPLRAAFRVAYAGDFKTLQGRNNRARLPGAPGEG